MKADRWLFIDILRFVAVLMMLQGHTFDAVLSLEIRQEAWYRTHAFWHGFTAPLFLFGSGLAFGIATFRKWEAHTVLGPAVYRRFRRYGVLLLIGYALHLPFFSLSKLLAHTDTRYFAIFVQSDALHLIALSLILSQALVYVLKDRRAVARALIALSVVVTVAAPVLWNVDVSAWLPLPMAAYLTNSTGSIFPFFPWSAYLFAGVVSGYLLRPWETARARADRLRLVAGLGLLFLLAGRVLDLAPVSPFAGMDVVWNANPVVLLSRVGALMIFLGALYQLEHVVRARSTAPDRAGPVLRFVGRMGQESLVIYVVHLLILYGSILGPGLNRSIGRVLDVPTAILVFVALTAAMYLLAVFWQYMKRHRTRAFRTAQLALTLAFVVRFLVSPY